MASRKKSNEDIRDINIIDMILIDHKAIKSGIEIFKSETSTKLLKMNHAKIFLDSIHKHAEAEKEIVYSQLEIDDEFHFTILEALIEHGIVEDKVRKLKQRVSRVRVLSDEIEAELKVLAELVEHHIKEEESELLPKMNEEVDEVTLKEMGQAFMLARKLTVNDLTDYPQLMDELVQWKDNVQKVSSQFLSKMDRYVENLKH